GGTNLRMGYDRRWGCGVQQPVGKTKRLDGEYVANKGTHIQGNDAFNMPDPGAGSVQARRPFPRFASFGYISSNTSSSYHALQAKFERRISAGLWFLGSYTFSKSLWNVQTPSIGGRWAFETGPSEYHVPHTFSLAYGYELPIGK